MISIVSDMTRRIGSVSDPEKIILFGSRARGTAHADSDFDILIIQDSDQPRYRRAATLYRILADLPLEVELVVYAPEEVNQWNRVPEAFIATALREGKVIYERENGPGTGLTAKGR